MEAVYNQLLINSIYNLINNLLNMMDKVMLLQYFVIIRIQL